MATQDSRILIKRSTTTGVVPTVPSSNDHTDGTWLATDIYKGELFFNQADGIMFIRDDSGIITVSNKSCVCIKSVRVVIPSAEVLALFTTPKEIIPAQGAGTLIEPMSVIGKMYNNTTPYATNVGFAISANGASKAICYSDKFINTVTSSPSYHKFELLQPTIISNTNLIENAAIEAKVAVGNPTGGDGDIEIFATYRVITV